MTRNGIDARAGRDLFDAFLSRGAGCNKWAALFFQLIRWTRRFSISISYSLKKKLFFFEIFIIRARSREIPIPDEPIIKFPGNFPLLKSQIFV